MKADASTITFVRDGSKNTRAELNASGSVTAAFRYRAYGQLAQNLGTSPGYIGYASQLLDPSGLIYMRARWYDAGMGRFTVRDSISGDPEGPATLNVYAYALANPVIYTDPSGRCLMLCTAFIGAVIGGVIGGVSYALQQSSKGEAIDPGKLAVNIGIGAVEGAFIGAFLPGAGFVTGAIWGAGEGLASDLSSQVISNEGDWSKTNWGEVAGATAGGGVGGLVSGGMLAPIAGVAVKDATTIAFANVASAELAFGFTVSGWALGDTGRAPVRGGGGGGRME